MSSTASKAAFVQLVMSTQPAQRAVCAAVRWLTCAVRRFVARLECSSRTRRGGGDSRVAELLADAVGDLLELAPLDRGELVEQVVADSGNMPGGGGLQDLAAFGGEHGEGAPFVAWAALAADPAGLLDTGDGVGEAAAREQRLLGQLRHAHALVSGLGKANQQLVVGVGEA